MGSAGREEDSLNQRPKPRATSVQKHRRRISAITGTELHCKSWQTEGAYRMLHNVLDREVAKDPDHLIVYGGTGRAARSWDALEATLDALEKLGEDQTLLIQSGKPFAVFKTHRLAPRVLIVNSMIVPKWATWDYFYELEQKGLIMYGQMTAGSWAYIGTQGILQGTYETLARVAKEHFHGTLAGRLVLTAGLGEMGGAQPLAVTMNDGIALAVEIDKKAIEKRIRHGYLQTFTDDMNEALDIVQQAKQDRVPRSVGLLGNAAEMHPEPLRRRLIPDVVTDQTSAHDPLNGYYPAGLSKEEADSLRRSNPEEYMKRVRRSILTHVKTMIAMSRRGAVAFEYGNNIRQQALDAGLKNAFEFPGFVQRYIRPMFCEGRGPFRWTSLVGDPDDIRKIDELVLSTFPQDHGLSRWIRKAQKEVKFQGLPARMCLVADGTPEASGKLERVLTTDPGIGIVRHADAGYTTARKIAREKGVQMPMLK